MAVLLSGSGFDAIGKLGLQPLLDDPAAAITRLPVMAYLPHYLDILPLYIVLFAFLPLIILGLGVTRCFRWPVRSPATARRCPSG